VAIRADVDGVGRFLSGLEKFNKDVAKTLKAEMRAGAREVSSAAKGLVPGTALSGWGPWNNNGRDLGFQRGGARSGYKPQISRYRRRGVTESVAYDVVQKSPGGGIFEGVGAGSSTFVQNVVGKWGPRPNVRGGKRLLLPAYYQGIGPATDRIVKAIRRAERSVGL
jgi:hypothetical protein